MIIYIKSNQIKEVKGGFEKAIKSVYEKKEAENIFFLLSEHHLGLNKSDFFLNKARSLSESEILCFEKAAKKLLKNIPIQYIIGSTEFYGCKIKVDERVLIPRPETEELVDMIVKENIDATPLRILDIGTGSGCIPIALEKNMNCALVKGMDVSVAALELARSNAKINEARVEFILDDILERNKKYDTYDIIVSNPPYIEESRREQLEKRVIENEPTTALFVPDTDPIVFYKAIIKFCVMYLKIGGVLYLEINEAFPKETKSLFSSRAWDAKIVLDIEGKSRFIRSKKLSE